MGRLASPEPEANAPRHNNPRSGSAARPGFLGPSGQRRRAFPLESTRLQSVPKSHRAKKGRIMSEVTVTRCDKCEKFVEKNEAHVVKHEPNDERDANPPHDFDLCQACATKLLKWFGVGT